jgi:hypothetical protein
MQAGFVIHTVNTLLLKPFIIKHDYLYHFLNLFFIFSQLKMRTKALILFFPFAIFLAETASFTPAMKNACAIIAAKKNTCKKEKKENTCSQKKEKSACTKIKKQDKCCNKNRGKAPADNPCNDNPDCSTCPVCYTFIAQQQYEWQAQQFFLKKNYGLSNKVYISLYTSDVWKPPNGFMYTS